MGKGTDASDTNAKMTLGCSALTFIMGMLHSDYYALKKRVERSGLIVLAGVDVGSSNFLLFFPPSHHPLFNLLTFICSIFSSVFLIALVALIMSIGITPTYDEAIFKACG